MIDWTLNGIFPSGIIDKVYSFYGRKGVVPNGYSPYPAGTIRPSRTTVITPGGVDLVCYAINTYAYQWESSRDGTTWATMVGKTTKTIIESYQYISGDEGNHWYRCICKGYVGESTTAPVKITVTHPLPVITIAADKTIITTPDTISFSASATNAESYQWQKDGVDIPAATASSYTASFAYGDAGTYAYTCKATGLGGTTTSAAITVVVSEPVPTITISPGSATIDQGQTITITATATYTESYEWHKLTSGVWVVIPGVSGPSYTTEASDIPRTDQYRCVAIGLGGTATSNESTITTQPITPTVSISVDKTAVVVGETFTFTATYSPTTAAVELQQYQTDTWVTIGTGSPIPTSSASAGVFQYRYSANNYGLQAFSDPIEITVT